MQKIHSQMGSFFQYQYRCFPVNLLEKRLHRRTACLSVKKFKENSSLILQKTPFSKQWSLKYSNILKDVQKDFNAWKMEFKDAD